MIEKFNANNLKTLRADISRALDAVAKEHGLKSLSIGNISYNEEEFTSRLTAKTNFGKTEEEAAKELASIFGIDEDLVGKPLKSGNETYTLVEIKASNRKYPFICEKQDGRRYKLSQSQFERIVAHAG